MDRTTAVMTWREVCGSDAVMASMPPTGRMLEDFARRIEAAERERISAQWAGAEWMSSDGPIDIGASIRAGRDVKA